MRLCFNIDLPERDLKVGTVDLSGRSYVGYEGHQYKRFFPLIICLETLVRLDEWQANRLAMAGTPLKPLYEAGLVYREEPPDSEEWQDVCSLYKQGYGDCEDLACARAAELRGMGVAAVACIRFRRYETTKGPLTMVHVLVLWPNGHIEDPSARLGMHGGQPGEAYFEEWIGHPGNITP